MKITKNNTKIKISKKHTYTMLTIILLCIAVVSATFRIINQKLKFSSQSVINVEKSSSNISQEDKDKFGGVPVINDNRGVPVICYHSIGEDPSGKNPIIISVEKFRQHLQTIKDDGYTTLTMAQLSDYVLRDKPIPEKSVVLTFDDGYIDNYTNVFPILKEFNMNATIFVISTYLDGVFYMTPNQVKEMSDYGIDIESHTVTHRRLSELSYEEQLNELKKSKDTIEGITGKPIIAIAYPEGKFNEDTKKAMMEAGYSMGFTINRGYVDRDDEVSQLNRICVDYTYKPRNIEKILKDFKKN
jgi:peptidoglycan/xylan/chitin deacetylase (PgdA/CDA1 family)